MKLFTFSGVSASLSGVNAGLGLIELAKHVVDAMPTEHAPVYRGIDDVDHFRSYVNFGTMLGVFQDLVRLDGSTVLNEEAGRSSPQYAAALANAAAAAPGGGRVKFRRMSQGTNNLTWTCRNLPAITQTFLRSVPFGAPCSTRRSGGITWNKFSGRSPRNN